MQSVKMSGVNNMAFESSENLNKTDENDCKLELQQIPKEEVTTSASRETNEEENQKKKLLKMIMYVMLNFIFVAYFSYVTYHYVSERDSCQTDCELSLCSPYGMLVFIFTLCYLGLLYFKLIKPCIGDEFNQMLIKPARNVASKLTSTLHMKLLTSLVITAAFSAYIIYETYSDFTKLRALLAIIIFISLGLLVSENPKEINWRPVVCGAIFQFVLGVVFIRWPVGRNFFQCFGDKVVQFLSFGKHGSSFIYGEDFVWNLKIFAFAVLPTIYFVSLSISVCYYLGVIQWLLIRLGWILQSILGTTVCESVNTAANIFLGQSESPLIIRPYIKYLTNSEIHAIMTSGFSTVSGSVLVAYISFGAEPSHLITASVMAAPASLFFSKLVYPETEESMTSSSNIQLEKSTDSSILDAASNGASQAIPLVLNIIANVVAFVAVVNFADEVLLWFTGLMGLDNIGIQFILGKLFMPVSWLLGIDWKDCEAIGNVIGMKTFINEFVAFEKLGKLKQNGEISMKSAAIATFAICSFANPGSIGITIGGLSSLCPEKKPAITKVVLRAFLSACFVSLCTASIAGLLMTDEMLHGM